MRYLHPMDDEQIHRRIEELVSEEHELWKREADGGASAEERRRLGSIRATLDRCWDLLRQRRALREAGLDADTVQVRDADVVECYQQ